MQEEGEVENELLAEGPHHLEKTWVLFYDNSLQGGRRGGANDWAKSMKRIAEFSTIEQFWVRQSDTETIGHQTREMSIQAAC